MQYMKIINIIIFFKKNKKIKRPRKHIQPSTFNIGQPPERACAHSAYI